MKNTLFLKKKRKVDVITSLDESDQEQPTEEGEALSDTDATYNTEELIRVKAECEELKKDLAKIMRLCELAENRLEEMKKGSPAAYVATPEEVELDRWYEMKESKQTDQK